jgi:hypothetical protein
LSASWLAGRPRWLRDIIPLLALLGLIFWLSSRSRLVHIGDPAGEKVKEVRRDSYHFKNFKVK